MTDILLFAIGCAIFAMTTVATLIYGYMTFNRVWLADHPRNPEMMASSPDENLLPADTTVTVAAPDQFH
ncbi:MAG: hypothetical protein ACFCVK_14205 [Acidimicrobiales bacterium]